MVRSGLVQVAWLFLSIDAINQKLAKSNRKVVCRRGSEPSTSHTMDKCEAGSVQELPTSGSL